MFTVMSSIDSASSGRTTHKGVVLSNSGGGVARGMEACMCWGQLLSFLRVALFLDQTLKFLKGLPHKHY